MGSYANQTFWERINSRHGQLERRRALYDDQVEEIREVLRPDLVSGREGDHRDEGAFEGSAIVEGTGPWAAATWQRGFQGGVLSRKFPWFRDRARESSDPDAPTFKGNDDVNTYLQDFDDHMFDVYRRSTFYDVAPSYILDGGTVGSPVMLREEDPVGGNIVCKVPHYKQRYLDKDIMGRDNVLHILWEWDSLTMSGFFEKSDWPTTVKTAMENGTHYEKKQYLQVIYGAGDPIFDDLPGDQKVAQTHPWMEFFIALNATGEDRKILHPKNKGPGYFHRPFSSWHYWRNWNELYARTPGWWAIYDIRGSNAQYEALYGEAELSLRPPVWAMQAMEGMLNLGPAGASYARDENEYASPPAFIERPSRYDVGLDFAQRLQASIERWYHVPFFLQITQTMARKTQPESVAGLIMADMERAGQVAPEVETYENQVLSDNHEGFIEIERRAGRLPEPPDILLEWSDGGDVDVEFIGELSQAQNRNRSVNNFFRNIGIAELIFKWKPETVERIKWSQALERLMEAGNFPQKDLRDEDDYQQLIALARQRELQQELLAQAPALAKGVKDLQGATEEGSPLEAITA